MANLGFPYADVDAAGNATLGKVEGTGGLITLATAKEQLLYEVTDPFGYVTPDVVADFSTVSLRETGPDRVAVRGATGRRVRRSSRSASAISRVTSARARSATGAPTPMARARLAGDIVRERLGRISPTCGPI